MKKPEALKYFLPALGLVWEADPLLFSQLFAVTLLSGFLPVGQAYFARWIVDSVLASIHSAAGEREGLRAVLPYLAGELALVLLGILLGQLRRYASDILNQKLAHSIAVKVMEKSAKLEVQLFETPSFQDKLQSARQETRFRAISLMNASFLLVQNGITLASFAAPIVILNPWIALLLFTTALPAFVVQNRYSRISFRLHSWQAPEVRKMSYYEHLLTTEASVREVKVFGLTAPILDRHKKLFRKVFEEDSRLAARKSVASVLWGLAGNLGFYFCYGWVIARTVARAISLGQMTFYLTAFRQLQGTFSGVFDNVNSVYENSLYMHHVFGILDLPEKQPPVGKRESAMARAGAALEFRAVSFRYPGSETWALRDFNLVVKPGQKVALVGENGSGKTTFAKLLTRLYEPTEGEIFLFGKPIQDFSESEFYSRIGAIFQDFVRYQASASENVGFGSVPNLENQERLAAAAEQGGALDMIEKLPEGWNTLLGGWFKGGHQLSGGQWQKMALSRAFMREADLLVFDEPTSALDAGKEHEIFERIRGLPGDKIAFLISHRFSTVRMADLILVLEQGRVVESGSHGELIAKKGIYEGLFNLQAAGYR
jgi:ATP-binding cassette, subfamily B, bacterial